MSKTAKQDIYKKRSLPLEQKIKIRKYQREKRLCEELRKTESQEAQKKTNIAYQKVHAIFLCIQFRLGQAQYPFGSELWIFQFTDEGFHGKKTSEGARTGRAKTT